MKNIDSKMNVRGESLYLDDYPVKEGCLHAVVYGSPVAHGRLKSLDLSEAKKMPGVVAIFTAKDIPGENQIGSIIPDEPLMADEEIHYKNMPTALVVARSEIEARRAIHKIKAEIEELPAIVCPREAKEKKKFIVAPRTFKMGAPEDLWDKCDHVFSGTADMGGQEHVYLETQGSYASYMEDGSIRVQSGTQATSYVQVGIQKVLGLPQHMIEVETIRLGGAFGGKEDQGTPWACLASLACYHLKKPVKLVLHRLDDMRMTGKRHPYAFDYKIGFSKDHKIMAYEVECYQNGGASADVSPAVMERTLFHGGSSYFIPNIAITVYSCRTNLPPNTAFRGFGGPQGMFVLEAAIFKAAHELGIDASVIQEKNLLYEGSNFPYGQIAWNCDAKKSWEQLHQECDVEEVRQEIEEYNKTHQDSKKGMAIFPLCFGVSFTKTSLNQGFSLVHIYKDGSVSISTGVIEMGQGVNTKITQVASDILSIAPERIRIHPTNTTRTANASPTAASTGADLNGKATQVACTQIKDRLIKLAAKLLNIVDCTRINLQNEKILLDGRATEIDWNHLILQALEERVKISELAHYATPQIYFDKTKEKGHPFAYHVYGTALLVSKVDCLRGTYEIEKAHIVHDFGKSMNLDVDVGQIEGALMQGIGLMTIEELLYNEKGTLVYDNLSSYKIPDIFCAPKEVIVSPLKSKPNELALYGSKAVGEPPLCYGIAAYFSIVKAMQAFNSKMDLELSAPITHQKVMETIYQKLC